MTKLTTHALDIYSGKPAKGLKVDVYFIENKKEKIKSIILNNDGRPDDSLSEKVKVGKYELVFHVGEYFKNKIELKDPNFLDEVSIGHALISESLYLGIENVINLYLQKMKR